MAKLTKFKAQQVEFPTHYEVEETNRGNNKIKSIVPAFGNIRENGTPETEEIYDGLQLGNVHTLQANKTTNLNIDYYVCNLDGLNEFGINNDLKLRINVDSKNTNSTTKLRLNNNDYTILKEYNGNLKQIEAGDFKQNKTYELTYNGSQFVVINVDSRLNEIMGLEFGGNIQDIGDKVRGKCYFDNVTKFYYECIEDNSLTYNDSGKFRAISNKPLSDKVENLFKFGKDWVSFPNGLKIQWGFSIAQNGDDIVRLISPFKSSDYQVVACDSGGGTYITGMTPLTNETFKACGRDPYTLAYKSFGFRWVAIGY